jgi:hypothetical protein
MGPFAFGAQPVAEPSPDLANAASGLIGPALSAAVGVLMRHSQLAQRGDRKLLSIHLLYEAPTVMGVGIIAGGIGDYMGMGVTTISAGAAILGWLGPKGIDMVVSAIAKRFGIGSLSVMAPPAAPVDRLNLERDRRDG